MSRLLLISALALGSAASFEAQQSAPPPAPVDAVSENAFTPQVKAQVRSFEYVLRAAVEGGGRRLAERARQVIPSVQLAMAGEPRVLGAPHPDGGFVFTVQIPDILPSYLAVLELQRGKPPMGGRPVSTPPPGSVGATVVPDDPMKSGPADFDPDREYSDFVRESLIDAMIENSLPLSVGGSSELVIVASVPDAVRRDPLDTSRLLILSIKGEHLQAYRQGRISKEDAKLRVVDRRF